MIKSISISGFRGFGKEQTLEFALPNGVAGSGMTFLVGANNSGKTSVLEAIKSFNGDENPSFSEGKRNIKTKQLIEFCLINDRNISYIIKTIDGGGSSTLQNPKNNEKYYVLPSRRFVNYEFSRSSYPRDLYITQFGKVGSRTAQLDGFYTRLFKIQEDQAAFDTLLAEIMGERVNWTIEQNDNGSHYVKYSFGAGMHSSEGIGDGIWSIFTICDALYDSPEGSVILIDEPELSIHPTLQKRLIKVLMDHTKNKQIILSTHSPYFVNWEAIVNGANLIRTSKDKDQNVICSGLSKETKENFRGILRDLNNPHTLGISANEVFFLDDNVILVEGQEDVVILSRIVRDLKMTLDGDFFGWGVGGAPKMPLFLQLFKDLGYKKVTAIYDGDKNVEMEQDKQVFADYKFVLLQTEDIRDKEARTHHEKVGITDSKGNIKDGYKDYAIALINGINQYFDGQ